MPQTPYGIDVPQWLINANGAMEDQKSRKGKNAAVNNQAYQTAAHQGASGPFGSESWTKNPDGSFTQNQGFSGPLANASNSLMNQAASAYASPMDNGSAVRDQAINAMYGQATSRLNPQWDQRQEQLQSQLANQGLDPNSQAYRTAMQQFGQQRNDAYSSAMNNAIGMGNEAQNLTFQQNLAARNAPLQALQNMRSLIPGDPGNQGLEAMMGANNYATAMNQMGNEQGADIMKGVGQVGGALALASDSRLKEDIQRLPVEAAPGVPVAAFRFKGAPGKYVGVIAQDLEKVAPDKVKEGPDGYKRVSPEFRPFRFK